MNGPACHLAVVAITSRCSLRCRSCYAGQQNRHNDLSPQILKGVLGDLRNMGVSRLVISGGEPLLTLSRTLICLNWAKRLGMRVTLTTSGLGMTRSVARQLAKMEFGRVQISLDGPDAECNALTREDSFHPAVAALRIAVLSGLDVSAMMVVHRGNLHRMRDWIGMIMDIGVKFATFDRFCSYNKETKAMELGPDELTQFHENYLWIRQRERIALTCNDPLLLAREFRDLAMLVDWEAIPIGGCTAGIESIYIDASGMVYPCTKLRIALGNVAQTSIGEIWKNNGVLGQLRNRQQNLCCQTICSYWRICGGCRAQAFETSGELFAVDPACYLI